MHGALQRDAVPVPDAPRRPRWPALAILLGPPFIMAGITTLPTSMDREVHSLSLPQDVDRFVLFFGYVDCPAICPTTMAALREVYLRVIARQNEPTLGVGFVNLIEAPSGVAQQYAQHFHPSFTGLQAHAEDRGALMRELGVRFDRSAEGPAGWHTDSVYLLVNMSGHWRLRKVVRSPIDIDQLTTLIQEL